MGVPVPDAWHVWLSVNGRPMGLYTALESLDERWLTQRGQHSAGIYYAVGTDGTFGLIDPETEERKQHLASGYEKVWPHADDVSDLEQLIYQITLPTDAEFERQIDGVIDVECFLRWLIGVEFMSHTDGLVQNYALFRPEGGRWQISPWDCDGTWGRIPNGSPIEADYMVMGTGDDNYLAIRLLRAPRWRRRYRALWTELLDGALSRRNVGDRLDAIYQEIRADALRDEEKRWSNSTFLREPRKIRKFYAERLAVAQALMHELARKGQPG
jgi:spore coat protein H